MRHSNNGIIIAAIGAVSIAIMAKPLFTSTISTCVLDDLAFYLNWTRQFERSILEGTLYPRWMPESHGGYGNPTFIFYPPVAVFITAVFDIVTGDIILSVNLVKLLGLFLSGLFMYIFANDLWGRKAGTAAAIVYMALPARLFMLDFSGLYASKLAYAWLPLILYLVGKAAKEERLETGIALTAFSVAVLCLTHSLSFYMMSPLILVFGLTYAGHGKRVKAGLIISLGVLLGFCLCAFYLLPLPFEHDMVHFDRLFNDDMHNYWSNYVINIFTPRLPFYKIFYAYFTPTLLTSSLLVLSFLMLSNRYSKNSSWPEPAIFVASFIGSLFLMTSLSDFLWANIPGMRLLQFPFRWVSISLLSLACLVGAGIGKMEKAGFSLRKALTGGWGLLFMISLLLTVYYHNDAVKGGCSISRLVIAGFPPDLDVEEYVPKNVSLEWLREEIKKPAGEKIMPIPPGKIDRITIRKWAAQERSFTVDADKDTKLRVRTFYYPGWRALIDGQEAMISTEPVSGAMLIKVPKGSHAITLSFSDTPVRKAGKLLSALAAALILYLLSRQYIRKKGINTGHMDNSRSC